MGLPEMTASDDRTLPTAPQGVPGRDSLASAGAAKTAGGFAAQVLGQGGIKRGLKGGAPVLTAAKAAYLGAEFSGDHDRRPSPGLLRRASV